MHHSPDTDPPEGQSSVVPYHGAWLARHNDEGFCPAFLWETEKLAIAWVEYMETNDNLNDASPERMMENLNLLIQGQRRSAVWNELTQRFELDPQTDEEIYSLFNSVMQTVGQIRKTA